MRDGAEPTTAALDVLGAAIAHRGPDGHGHYVKGSVGFRHDRLAIIDLSTGDQPLYDDAGRALVVNGEIYDYREIKAALPEAHWRTQSDCEPLLALYDRHGLAFLDRVRGMYALALHDPGRNRVVLARDPFGIKPALLCDRARRRRLCFRSPRRSWPVAAWPPGAMRRPSGPPLPMNCLQLQFTTGRATIFEGVERVLPGEILVVEGGAIGRAAAGAAGSAGRRAAGARGAGTRRDRPRGARHGRDARALRRALRAVPVERHRFLRDPDRHGAARRRAGALLYGCLSRDGRPRRARDGGRHGEGGGRPSRRGGDHGPRASSRACPRSRRRSTIRWRITRSCRTSCSPSARRGT